MEIFKFLFLPSLLLSFGCNSSFAADSFQFPSNFLFGLANAPAHVEDNLDDTWSQFAREGKIKSFSNQAEPEERLQFWSHPEVEIDLAASTGIKIFRLGVDWGRLVPLEPGSESCNRECSGKVQNLQALARYKYILDYIRSKNMQVMLTLFHHSSPKWLNRIGGWRNPLAANYFNDFALDVIQQLNSKVDYWITFNEPTVFVLLTHVTGLWPLDGSPANKNPLVFANTGFYKGAYATALENIVTSHKYIYHKAHQINSKIKISVAHHFSYFSTETNPQSLPNSVQIWAANALMTWGFMEKIVDTIDYVGMNYYGAEYTKAFQSQIVESKEYSESGRAISPNGFYLLLKQISSRLKKPIFITENGIADSTDILRPSYLTEHLAALHAAMDEGVPVLGYIFWTISDNWEWADGYCPKFGLFEVDRIKHLARIPRPSYFLFKQIVSSNRVEESQRQQSWELVQKNIGKQRTFCRAADGINGLDEPRLRTFSHDDWRFSLKK